MVLLFPFTVEEQRLREAPGYIAYKCDVAINYGSCEIFMKRLPCVDLTPEGNQGPWSCLPGREVECPQDPALKLGENEEQVSHMPQPMMEEAP